MDPTVWYLVSVFLNESDVESLANTCTQLRIFLASRLRKKHTMSSSLFEREVLDTPKRFLQAIEKDPRINSLQRIECADVLNRYEKRRKWEPEMHILIRSHVLCSPRVVACEFPRNAEIGPIDMQHGIYAVKDSRYGANTWVVHGIRTDGEAGYCIYACWRNGNLYPTPTARLKDVIEALSPS